MNWLVLQFALSFIRFNITERDDSNLPLLLASLLACIGDCIDGFADMILSRRLNGWWPVLVLEFHIMHC